MSQSSAQLAVALDVPTRERALGLAAKLQGVVPWLKVGLELFVAQGPSLVGELKSLGFQVFLDLKLLDIPNTVRGGVRSAAASGADLLTLHAMGGPDMLKAAAGAARETGLQLAAVTVLTSYTKEQAQELFGQPPGILAPSLAQRAWDAGLGWVVASADEAAAIKESVSPGIKIITPGIRLADTTNDQARVAKPSHAVRQGSDLLVVGRPIHGADDPVLAARRYLRDMGNQSEP